MFYFAYHNKELKLEAWGGHGYLIGFESTLNYALVCDISVIFVSQKQQKQQSPGLCVCVTLYYWTCSNIQKLLQKHFCVKN